MLEPIVLGHKGQVMKRMGDGWIFAMPSAQALVDAATDLQLRLSGHQDMRVRIAGHRGEIVEDESDFYGAGVNLTQRILTEAPPGGLMVSKELFDQFSPLAQDRFRDAGSFRLKNIALPVTLYQWRPNEGGEPLDGDVPSIKLEAFTCGPDDQETRSAGQDLHDQLLERLSRRTGIRVLDESTVRSKIATYVLRGRLRIAGTRGRLNLSMVLVDDGRAVWSKSYEGDPKDLFEFCDAVIEQADVDLRVQINAFDADRLAHLPVDRLSVSELRSRAAGFFYRGTMESYAEAQTLMDRALQLSPDDPMAMAMRTEAVIGLAAARFEDVPAAEAGRLSQDMNRVVELLPRSDYAFYVRGLFHLMVAKDDAAAAKDANRSILLSPAYAVGFELLGQTQMAAGQFRDAARNFQRAVDLSEADPLLPMRLYMLAMANICLGADEAAIEALDAARQLRPRIGGYGALRAIAAQRSCTDKASRDGELLSPSPMAPRLPLPVDFGWLAEALTPSAHKR